MGRQRSKDKWLPKGVYKDRYGYYVRKPYTRLCGLDSSKSDVHLAYERWSNDDNSGSLSWLVALYKESDDFRALAANKSIGKALDRLLAYPTKSGKFGDVPYSAITPGVIRKYLDSRTGKKAANREVAYLSGCFTWAYSRDMVKLNPCRGVKRNPEKPRSRYVTDAEFNAVLKKLAPREAIAAELCYLLAARISEVLGLTRADLSAEGVRVARSKGSKTNIVRWSPRLEDVVNRALALPKGDLDIVPWLIHEKGHKVSYSAFRKQWSKVLGDNPPFTTHDLKAKGISDSTATNPAGHKTVSIVENVYRRKIDEVEPPK